MKRLDDLVEAAATCKEAAKKLKKELDAHADQHCQSAKYKKPITYLGKANDLKRWLQDVMHGLNLNMAKVAFKYCFLDGADGTCARLHELPLMSSRADLSLPTCCASPADEMREAIAAVLIMAGVPFDCRSAAKNGGSRDDNKKWMKASVVNVLFAKMPSLIWDFCDVRFLTNLGDPEPLDGFEDISPLGMAASANDAATGGGGAPAHGPPAPPSRPKAPKISRPGRVPVAAQREPGAAGACRAYAPPQLCAASYSFSCCHSDVLAPSQVRSGRGQLSCHRPRHKWRRRSRRRRRRWATPSPTQRRL